MDRKSHSLRLLSRQSISCHQLAKNAHELSKSYAFQIGRRRLNPDSYKILSELMPLHVIKRKTKYEFFAGWFMFDRGILDAKIHIPAIVYPQASDNFIRDAAWTQLLIYHLFDLERHSSLAQLSRLLEAMPTDIKQTIFPNDYSHSSAVLTGNLTESSRSAIRHQLAKLNSHEPMEVDILTRILSRIPSQ